MAAKKKVPITLESLADMMQAGFKRFDTFAENAMEEFDRINGRLDRVEADVAELKDDMRAVRRDIADINRRLDRLEERGESNAGFAKEIDELRQRVLILESQLKSKECHSS
jgi:predicted  nucleic acid-binding Zn-ribbon protein